MTSEQISAVWLAPMPANDAEADTVREYLCKLLGTLWRDGEGFSGKRPFGNSGWQWDVYVALVRAGLVEGKIDSDGYLEECDEAAADEMIESAIEALAVMGA